MDKQYYLRYYELERSHWWFKARLKILEEFISKLIEKQDSRRPLRILNAGIATGATSEMLAQFGEVTSLEYDEECCDFVREKLKISVTHGSLTELPFSDQEFDLVCAFDVIEHIEDHAQAIKEMKRVLSAQGNFVVTVPAYNFLWSEHDEINHHFRRYSKKDLNHLIHENGLKSAFSSYFNFWLFPLIASTRILQRLMAKPKKGTAQSDFDTYKGQNIFDKLFFSIFKSERFFTNRHINLPFGVSILTSGGRE